MTEMHYKRKAETTLSLCGDASANFTCDIQYVTCLSCSKLQDDWLNPNLHTFEIDPKVAGCARCGQSVIAHASVPTKKTDRFTLLDINYEDLRKDAEWFREDSNLARENYLGGLQETINAANLKAKQFRELAAHYERTANDIERFLAKDHSSLPQAMEE